MKPARRVVLMAVAIGIVLAVPATAQVKTLLMQLQWRVNVEHSVALPAVDMTGGLRSLRIEPVVNRLDAANMAAGRTKIGENTEKKVPVGVFTDSKTEEFVTAGLLPQLKSAGLPIAAGDADLVLRCELTEFWATETTRYRASVRARFALSDAAGKELWVGMVGGVGDNTGRSLRDWNYNETFTSAVIDLAANLLKQEAFTKALKKSS